MSEISERANNLLESAIKSAVNYGQTKDDPLGFISGAEAMFRIDKTLLKDYIAELEAAQRWISVDDELPEEGQEVIMLNRNGLDVSLFYFSHISQEPFDSRYSHWIPKPEVQE